MKTTVGLLILVLSACPATGAVVRTNLADEAFATDPATPVSAYIELTAPTASAPVLEAYLELAVSCSEVTAIGIGSEDGESILVCDQMHLAPGQRTVRLDVTRALRQAQTGGAETVVLSLGPLLAGGEEPVMLARLGEGRRGQLVVATKPVVRSPLDKVRDDGVRKVAATEGPQRARVFDVHAFPNPFNPSTIIRLETPQPADVLVEVFDLRGRRVAELFKGHLPRGTHEVKWDGKDDRGATVASGVYLYRASAGPETRVGKISLLK